MNKEDIEKRMHELMSIIDQLNYEYYTLDSPSVDDSEYDSLIKELENLENERGK